MGNQALTQAVESEIQDQTQTAYLEKLASTWKDAVDIVEDRGKSIKNKLRNMSDTNKISDKNIKTVNNHILGIKRNAEIARIMLDFIPKDPAEEENQFYDGIAHDIANG